MTDGLDAYAGAAAVAAAVADGRLSRVEAVRRALDRQRRLGSQLNAVVTTDGDRALARAAAADRRGTATGPLDGVVFTAKDSFETAGLRTTAGASELAGHVPSTTAPAVARLEGAGALLLGKSNLPKLAGDLQTDNRVFGRTDNPWHPGHTPGGSSGGGAAAVAAGLSVLDVGSDHAGSVRIPAAYCGVFGHRPTRGLVPVRGHIPPMPGTRAPRDLTTVGFLARHAEDLALALHAAAGPGLPGARAWHLRLPAPPVMPLDGYRVAVWLDPDLPLDGAVRSVVTGFVDALAATGVRLTEIGPRIDAGEVADVFGRLLGASVTALLDDAQFEAARSFAAALDAGGRAEDGDDGGSYGRDARAVAQTHRDWLAADERRARLGHDAEGWFDGVDVFVAPVTPTTAPRHDPQPDRHARRIVVDGRPRPYFDQFAWVALSTVADLPTTVVPVGLAADGLPVGVQVMARRFDDLTALAFAGLLEAGDLTLVERPSLVEEPA